MAVLLRSSDFGGATVGNRREGETQFVEAESALPGASRHRATTHTHDDTVVGVASAARRRPSRRARNGRSTPDLSAAPIGAIVGLTRRRTPAMTTQDGWERYAGTLTRAMAEVLPEFPDEVFPEFPDEVLPEFPDEVRPQALEVADYWISVGLALGLERRHQAGQLLELIEADETERAALEEDAAAFVEEALR
jgi:hypothetical protein